MIKNINGFICPPGYWYRYWTDESKYINIPTLNGFISFHQGILQSRV